MNLFSKGSSSVADAVAVELLNEPDWYTSGGRVRGQVVISSRLWPQMGVEVLLVCEEHAELDPAQAPAAAYEVRRLIIAGESVDGERAAADTGTFPFELRILDDPDVPFLLPSFDADTGSQDLTNAVKWLVEVRVEYKGRLTHAAREIAFLPKRPRAAAQPLQTYTQDLALRAYEPLSPRKLAPLRTAAVQQFHEAVVVAQLFLPERGVEQAPAEVPLRLVVASSHPHLLAVTDIEVRLVQIAEARIGKARSTYFAKQDIVAPLNDLLVTLDDSVRDLTSYIANPRIENACSNFAGRWLSMQHHVQVKLRVCAVHRPDYTQVLRVSGPVCVLPPRARSEHIDAPPQYTPPTPAEAPATPPMPVSGMVEWLSPGEPPVMTGR